ncbi:hypothetical protein FBZ99_101277 [Rhizobium sp. ERR 1071]|uniref:terminase small subunit n=1 Tax=Rhizobium sp. ERR 1071 TaxID=2572677 RepID=UPI00119BD8B0|nr:terminase small subunit [Rhizobium sp. ERR1071]TWB19504.1 hypothetical protein FBZ99_101277 [Rhizobium sp. ERR1071]
MATIAEVADHIDVNTRTAADLVARGVITKSTRSSYDLNVARVEYIRHLREVAAGREAAQAVPPGKIDGEQERARKDKEAADRLELQNAVTRGELAPLAEMVSAVTSAFARVRAKILTIPSKVAPLIVGETSTVVVRDVVKNEVHNALEELAGTRLRDWTFSPPGDSGELLDGADTTAQPDNQRVGRQRKTPQSRGVGRTRKMGNGKS